MNYEMENLIPIVAELAQKYAGCDSTSITYEKAQMLMEGVIYCLNECSSSPYGLESIDLSAKEQYHRGARLVFEKASEVRSIYNEMSAYFDDYGVACLHDTIVKGIPAFLKRYDVKFCPQDTLLTLDYPILTDIHSLTGVDAVHAYIKAIRTEQLFLSKFDRNYVMSILKRANSCYEDMIENVCEIVLTNIIGHIVLGKPLQEYGFQEKEYDKLCNLFSLYSISDIEDTLKKNIEEIVWEMNGNDKELLDYLYCDVKNIAVRIDTAARNQQLDKLFVL